MSKKKEWKKPTLANYHGIISRFLDLKHINHYDLDSDKPKVVQEFETFRGLVESMAKEERE